MNENILYSIGGKFNFLTLIPFFIFIILLTARLLLPKIKVISKKEKVMKTASAALLICSLAILGITAVSSANEAKKYKTLMEMHDEGSMIISTGVIKEYKINGSTESFSVGGTELSFDTSKFSYGYNISASKGGVIAEGKMLKIGYAVYKGETIILYIENIAAQDETDQA